VTAAGERAGTLNRPRIVECGLRPTAHGSTAASAGGDRGGSGLPQVADQAVHRGGEVSPLR
jgi:hypothetical protein